MCEDERTGTPATMSSKRHILLPAALLVSTWAWHAGAQVPVTEAQGGGRSVAAQPAPGNNQVLVDLFLQLQALQTEVQSLRGIVEEQGYQIRRMEQEQRDRYLDLDRRLSALGNGGGSAPDGTLTPGTGAPPSDAGEAPGGGGIAPLLPPGGGSPINELVGSIGNPSP